MVELTAMQFASCHANGNGNRDRRTGSRPGGVWLFPVRRRGGHGNLLFPREMGDVLGLLRFDCYDLEHGRFG